MIEQTILILEKVKNNELSIQEAQEQLFTLFNIDNKKCKDDFKLKASGIGIVVDKSKATKTYHSDMTPFPKGSSLNP